MGYAGNSEPSFIFPTVIATNETAGSLTGGSKTTGVEDLNFSIGDEAIANSQTMQAYYPVRHGLVDNWTHMEKYVLSLLFGCFLERRESNFALEILGANMCIYSCLFVLSGSGRCPSSSTSALSLRITTFCWYVLASILRMSCRAVSLALAPALQLGGLQLAISKF
jgi:hypothetical protein